MNQYALRLFVRNLITEAKEKKADEKAKKSVKKDLPLLLPAVPGAMGEVSFDAPETGKSSLNVGITRKLYRLELSQTGEDESSGEAGEPVRLELVAKIPPFDI